MADQEIIGATILAVKSLINAKWLFDLIKKYNYENIRPNEWYPMEQFTMLTDYYEKNTGPNVLKVIGEGIIPGMVKGGVIPKNLTPEEFCKSLSKTYHAANRGNDIGDWEVIKQGPKNIVLRNTTMHNCILEEGVVTGGVKTFGGKVPSVTQTKCVRKGDPECVFDVKWR